MMVKQLRERLEKMPEDAEVFIDKDLFSFPYESNHEKVSDVYPTPDGRGVVLIGKS